MDSETDASRSESIARLSLQDGSEIYVSSSSKDKPKLPSLILKKWQQLADLMARLLDQPHVLITHLSRENLSVLMHNATDDDTFDKINSFPLGLKVYCETTMTRNTVNYVPDALKDEHWSQNPSIGFGLVSYIGLVTRWPDGEVFGTLCSLDSKPHEHGAEAFDVVHFFRSVIEADLDILLQRRLREMEADTHKSALSEVHHRVKNHLNMIASMAQLEATPNLESSEEFCNFQRTLQARIKTVSELHSLLAGSGTEASSLYDYLRNIVERLLDSVFHKQVCFEASVDDTVVASDRLIYFGLILNELITNSVRHAFADHDDPCILLRVRSEGDLLLMEYLDNGPGLPEDFDLAKSSSLGLKIITELTTTLDGSLNIRNDSGAVFSFRFRGHKD